MFIVWGTKRRDETVGIVGDWCRDCGRLRKFIVQKHYQVPHIYWIPLGRYSYVATTCSCWSCGAQFYCSTKDFDDFLTEEEAEGIPASEVVGLTNSRRMAALGGQAASVVCPHCQTEFHPSGSRGALVCPGCDRDL